MTTNIDNILVKDREHQLSLQECFNIAWQWVKTHGPSITIIKQENNAIRCKYRSDNGQNACFIGACVPDSLYNPECESSSLIFLLNNQWRNIFRTADLLKLYSLQRCHDFPAVVKECNDPAKIKNKTILNLVRFAEIHNLIIP